MFRITVFTCLLLLCGCDAVNCIVNNHPEFSKNSLRNATLNQVFEDTIRVSISNSFEDNQYSYTFNLDGVLPQGISYESSRREITFSGTPTELGEFPVQLSVVAEIPPLNIYESLSDEPEDLCSNTETVDMVFSVLQGF